MEPTVSAIKLAGVKISGHGDWAYLLALYPVVTAATASAALVCAIAVWKTRRERLPLWFVFVGIVVTMSALALENALAFSSRITLSAAASAIPLWQLAAIKAMHTIGAGLHFWGAVLALARLTNGMVRPVIIGATIIVLLSYIALVWALK